MSRPATFIALAAALALFAAPAAAQSSPRRLSGVFDLGLERGGDRVAAFEYEDGRTRNVSAGGGLLFTTGGIYHVTGSRKQGVDVQLNTGIKWSTIPRARNQRANWLRIPVEALVAYRAPVGVRVALGPVVHLHNALVVSGVLDGRFEFETTPGLVLQAEYLYYNLGFDVRYTSMRYESAGIAGKVDASSIGVGLNWYYGRMGR